MSFAESPIMKPVHRNFPLSATALFLAIVCLAVPMFAAAQDSDEAADLQARRQKLMEKCKANRGTDCEHEVDVQMGTDQTSSPSVYVPPEYDKTRPIRPVPRPLPRPVPRGGSN
jgi:hypothetical protein